MKIYKYPLEESEGEIKVTLPHHARLLSVGLDPGGKLCLWAMVEPHNKTTTRHLFLGVTGGSTPEATAVFLGTVKDGPYMLHLFDLGEE